VETFLVWIAIGLIAGWLASTALGGGFGPLGDVIVGIVGAFLGGFAFHALRLELPFDGLAATICVAFAGAVVLLLILRVLRRGQPRVH
jgi:uncharacterized membrane protein YeaQ/YmgE (transglycosylase-associated protein family)